MDYKPTPVNTDDVDLPKDILNLCEQLAKNTHDVWAKSRMEQGWTYGEIRNDAKKETPCLVAYDNLSENEKEYDRSTAMQTLKLIIKLGYAIRKDV